MAGVILNFDDYTVTIPLLPNGDDAPRSVTLRGPSLVELAAINAIVDKAAVALPSLSEPDVLAALPVLPPSAEPEAREARTAARSAALTTPEGVAYQAEIRRRSNLIQSPESPYAVALVEIIKLLSSQDVTPADLFAWAAWQRPILDIVGFFQAPLPGAAAATA